MCNGYCGFECYRVYANLDTHRCSSRFRCHFKTKELRKEKKVYCKQCLVDFNNDKEALKEHREAMTCFKEFLIRFS